MPRAIARALLAAVILIPIAAAARQEDGTLGLIQTPNNGVPAIVLAGQSFEAVLTDRAELALIGGGATYALNADWATLPGGRHKAECTVAANVPPGTYTLHATGKTQEDENGRAVYLRETFSDEYLVTHITDTHIGKDQRHPRTSGAINRDVFAAVNDTGAAFVLVTGDLTESGEPEQFRRFLEILDTCLYPTYVCPGNHDRLGLHYEHFFGPLTYMFRFGKDGYLVFDTKDFMMADELGPQDTELQLFRRAIKPSRWSIGVTHRYQPMMGMRSQLALFVDDPLHLLIFGHWHEANGPDQTRVPWGTTYIVVTPAAIDGSLRIFDVSARGPMPREPQQVAAVE